jgi:hypothetical protein
MGWLIVGTAACILAGLLLAGMPLGAATGLVGTLAGVVAAAIELTSRRRRRRHPHR